jgi:AraC-like DNA-binding protein
MPAAVVRHGRELTGGVLPLEEVFFAHDAPSDAAALAAFFRAPMRLGAGANGVVVSAEIMDRPLIAANPALMHVLDEFARALLRSTVTGGDELLDAVRQSILANLTHSEALLPRVAVVLGMTARTLQRRLRERGCSFRDVVEEVRRGAAAELNARGGRSAGEMAYLLGYTERSSFGRAMRRWRARAG